MPVQRSTTQGVKMGHLRNEKEKIESKKPFVSFFAYQKHSFKKHNNLEVKQELCKAKKQNVNFINE